MIEYFVGGAVVYAVAEHINYTKFLAASLKYAELEDEKERLYGLKKDLEGTKFYSPITMIAKRVFLKRAKARLDEIKTESLEEVLSPEECS